MVQAAKAWQGLEDFSLEGYACVQVGNFHFSEEYLGHKEELVLLSPPRLMHQSGYSLCCRL